MKFFRWPRVMRNGRWRRVTGFSFKIEFDITTWRWIPMIWHHAGMFHWGCFRTWTNVEYDWG